MASNAVRRLSPNYERCKAFYDNLTDPEQLRPRVRMALRLYVHTAVPTLKAAAAATGLNRRYLANVARTKAGKAFMASAHEHINNTALTTNALIEKLGRRGIEVIGTMMEDASSEALRLKAAIDLADRAPETSKIHKHQVESYTLGSEDARAIAEAMVAASTVRQNNQHLIKSNYDKVNLDAIEDATPVVQSPTLTLEK